MTGWKVLLMLLVVGLVNVPAVLAADTSVQVLSVGPKPAQFTAGGNLCDFTVLGVNPCNPDIPDPDTCLYATCPPCSPLPINVLYYCPLPPIDPSSLTQLCPGALGLYKVCLGTDLNRQPINLLPSGHGLVEGSVRIDLYSRPLPVGGSATGIPCAVASAQYGTIGASPDPCYVLASLLGLQKTGTLIGVPVSYDQVPDGQLGTLLYLCTRTLTVQVGPTGVENIPLMLPCLQ